jgi:hypothetical protein
VVGHLAQKGHILYALVGGFTMLHEQDSSRKIMSRMLQTDFPGGKMFIFSLCLYTIGPRIVYWLKFDSSIATTGL